MPQRVTIREDLQIIQVDSWGDVTVEDVELSRKAVFKITEERGLSEVFIDATKETSCPSTFPIFEFGSRLATAALGSPGTRFAMATSPETHQTHHEIEFLETVAVNRGAQYKVFDSAEAALSWLIERPNKADAGDGK